MIKMNKKLILLLVLVLVIGVLGGCSDNKVEFKGVESKKLTKDFTKLRELVIDSLKDKEYKEDEINEILDKINDEKYQEKLSNTEIQLVKNINEIKGDLKYDLSNGKKIITSLTYDKINWLLQATTEKP